ncbi:Phosphotyrosine protein phosphatase I domain-containing protein [Plasmodiophora brassicae]|uniref:Phosphotyrosine protein phosphatase I domain-containing protein n=1 Tax=Plasmodiophora brassicae TaxID=37360 RepID=A0A0G4IGH0_PLABS|nr:hypothetical protein PBRA_000049 [Plasmodiophora brassicae]SPQ96624.1 unnamed protein product [Plasmodiophora brassicae]
MASSNPPKAAILFVCLGNICRSPLAHGIAEETVRRRAVSDRVRIDSCGTSAYHVGESPDARSIATARSHGIVISQQTCRQLCSHDFYEFTHIVAMDRDNLSDIKRRCPTNSSRRIANLHLFSEFIPKHSYTTADVPDPYYGGDSGFENVFTMLSDGMDPLIDYVASEAN